MESFGLDDATILADIAEISSSINTGPGFRMYFPPAETTENTNPRDMSIDQLRELIENLEEGQVPIEKAVKFWKIYKAKLQAEYKARFSNKEKEKTYPGVQVKRRRRLQIPWWIKLTKEYRSTLSTARSKRFLSRKKQVKGKKP